MFSTTDALVLNKFDMLPYFDFDVERVEKNEKDANPDALIFKVSNKTGDGLDELISWLSAKISEKTGK